MCWRRTKVKSGFSRLAANPPPSGGGCLSQTNNTFTGGVDLSGGTIRVANGPNEAGYLGAASNVLTISGNATFHNSNGQVTLPQGLTINGGVVGMDSGAFGERTQFDGVLAGSGTLAVQGNSANFIAEFRNTANTFTGPITVNSGDFVTLRMASLADSANTIGLDSQGGNGGKFEYMSGAIAPLVLNNRQFELITNGSANTNLSRQPSILSNASLANTVTVNTDLLVTGTGLKRFVLGGGNAGDNTFAGAIPDAIGTDVLHLYKQNSGKWILSGVNTYLGDTHVDQGNLTLASTGSLLFDIGLNGVNNQILGDAAPGTLDLEGSFAFDLSGADPTIGNTWDIVDSSILGSTTYSPSFSVTSFTDAGSDLWTLNTLGVQFQFDETTGILSTLAASSTPEPSTLILAALGFVGLIGTRRRRR